MTHFERTSGSQFHLTLVGTAENLRHVRIGAQIELDESAQPRDKRVRARVVCVTVRGAFDRAWVHSHTKDLLADLRGEDEQTNRKLATNLLAFIDSGNEEACHDLDDADYDD